jgi:hypothetical protein
MPRAALVQAEHTIRSGQLRRPRDSNTHSFSYSEFWPGISQRTANESAAIVSYLNPARGSYQRERAHRNPPLLLRSAGSLEPRTPARTSMAGCACQPLPRWMRPEPVAGPAGEHAGHAADHSVTWNTRLARRCHTEAELA